MPVFFTLAVLREGGPLFLIKNIIAEYINSLTEFFRVTILRSPPPRFTHPTARAAPSRGPAALRAQPGRAQSRPAGSGSPPRPWVASLGVFQ